MLCKCSHLFTALGCLQTVGVLCQSSELADTWSERCAATLAQICPQSESFSALSHHPDEWDGKNPRGWSSVQLLDHSSGLYQPRHVSPLSMARAQPWPACVPGTGWVRDKTGSCRSCRLTCRRLLCGEGAAVCCGGSPALGAYAFGDGTARKNLVLL